MTAPAGQFFAISVHAMLPFKCSIFSTIINTAARNQEQYVAQSNQLLFGTHCLLCAQASAEFCLFKMIFIRENWNKKTADYVFLRY